MMLFFTRFIISVLLEMGVVYPFFRRSVKPARVVVLVCALNLFTQPLFAFVLHMLYYPNLIYYILVSEVCVVLGEGLLFAYATRSLRPRSLVAFATANLCSWQFTPLVISGLYQVFG